MANPKLTALMKRKSVRIVCCLLAAYCMYDFAMRVWHLQSPCMACQLVAASKQLEQSPLGVERVEKYVSKLKAIDTSHAPMQVRIALEDYIAARQQGLDALNDGRDVTQYDRSIAEAEQRLLSAIGKYN